MISYMHQNIATLLSFFNMMISMVGLVHRIYGWSADLDKHKGKILLNIAICMIIFPIFIYINLALMNNSMESTRQASKLSAEMKTIKEISKQYSEML